MKKISGLFQLFRKALVRSKNLTALELAVNLKICGHGPAPAHNVLSTAQICVYDLQQNNDISAIDSFLYTYFENDLPLTTTWSLDSGNLRLFCLSQNGEKMLYFERKNER